VAAVPDRFASLGDKVARAGGVFGERGRIDLGVADRGAQTGHGIGLIRDVRVPVENPQTIRSFQGADDMVAARRDARDLFFVVPVDAVIGFSFVFTIVGAAFVLRSGENSLSVFLTGSGGGMSVGGLLDF